MSFSFLSINSYGSLRDLEPLAVLFLKGDVVKIAAVAQSLQAGKQSGGSEGSQDSKIVL